MEHISHALYKTRQWTKLCRCHPITTNIFTVGAACPFGKIMDWYFDFLPPSEMNRKSYQFIMCSHELWFVFWNLLFLLTRTIALFCSTLVSLIMTRMKLVTGVIIAPMCTTLLKLTQTITGRVTRVLWILTEMVCVQFWELHLAFISTKMGHLLLYME